jgi:DNA modification methylase
MMEASRTGSALCGVLHLPKIYKKDTNSMSASEIATNETLVSPDDTDISKLSAEELLAVVAELRQENKTLLKAKNKVGLTFKRIPEDGNDSITRLEDNQFPFLTKIDSLSVTKNESTDGNIALIEGENLAVLAALQMTHKEKVDVIYIDPPYNTGNDDFIYEDKRMYKSDVSDLENLEESLDGKTRTVGKDDPFRHSKWLSFMERRLFLAKELLNQEGILIVAIGDDEHHRLRLLMDDIFGESNFIANIVWQGGTKNNSQFTGGGIDHMIIFAKNKNNLREKNVSWSEPKIGVDKLLIAGVKSWDASGGNSDKATKLLRNWIKLNKNSLDGTLSLYNTIDDQGKIIRPNGNLSAPGGGGARYDVIHPITGKPCRVPNGGWRWTPARMEEELKQNKILFGETENTVPVGKMFLHELSSMSPKPSFIIDRFIATRQLEGILGERQFPFPKDHKVVKRWLNIVSSKKDAIILDFFAGSGTTGHAVAELNKEDGGNRSAILVTNNEGGIARNVTRERLARVLTGENWADGKEHEALPGNLSFYTLDFKTLSSNPLSTAQMMENKFDGLVSLENNALNVVENSVDEDYAIYRNSGKVVFVWKNLFSLYDGECEELLESLKTTIHADEFIAYVPSDSKDPGIASDGWKVIAFPHDYIERYEAMIATMRRNQTLPNNK